MEATASIQGCEPDVMGRVVKYIPAIRKEAYRIYSSHPRHGWMDIDDLVSVGIVAAIEASQRYDDARSVGFYVYMLPRVRGAILDMYRRKRLVDLQMCQSVGSVTDCQATAARTGPDLSEEILERQKRRLVQKAMDQLGEPQRSIVEDLYLKGLSLKDTAKAHSMSQFMVKRQAEMAIRTMTEHVYTVKSVETVVNIR